MYIVAPVTMRHRDLFVLPFQFPLTKEPNYGDRRQKLFRVTGIRSAG